MSSDVNLFWLISSNWIQVVRVELEVVYRAYASTPAEKKLEKVAVKLTYKFQVFVSCPGFASGFTCSERARSGQQISKAK